VTLDASAQAATARDIYHVGVSCGFSRLVGTAPSISTTSATVTAIVREASSNTEEVGRTGRSARDPGSLSQDDRHVIVMAADLATAGFPLPVKKGDKIAPAGTTDVFTVSRVDPYKRAMAGAIEITATGVP
jgi:hypothetical protein